MAQSHHLANAQGLQEASSWSSELTSTSRPPFIFVHNATPPQFAMPETKEPYAGSCNPARRVKQGARVDNPNLKKPIASLGNTQRSILPILPAEEGLGDGALTAAAPQPGPAKRGRKPGPLSRSARETQRKLNHSIIEKARRTKINEALATLRQLVPVDYGNPKGAVERDEDAESEGEREEGNGKRKGKSTGKREEKEKEFKLEILIRTVSFMQDLVERVKVLEAGSEGCSRCKHGEPQKRKRPQLDDGDEVRGADSGKRPSRPSDNEEEVQKSTEKPHSHPPSVEGIAPPRPYLGSRLPSISSWLPNSQIDPLLLSPTQRHHSDHVSQLPSPPSSTHFDPIYTSHIPPVLNLGPIAISSLLSPIRSPEDESAASLLLQISASSPQLLPISSTMPLPSTSFDMSKIRTSCVTPVNHRAQVPQAQTPGSMLGLKAKRG